MKYEKLKNLRMMEDGQLRWILENGMITITPDLQTYASLVQYVEEAGENGDLRIAGSIFEGFKRLFYKKPHYKELCQILLDANPRFETYVTLTDKKMLLPGEEIK